MRTAHARLPSVGHNSPLGYWVTEPDLTIDILKVGCNQRSTKIVAAVVVWLADLWQIGQSNLTVIAITLKKALPSSIEQPVVENTRTIRVRKVSGARRRFSLGLPFVSFVSAAKAAVDPTQGGGTTIRDGWILKSNDE